MKTFTLRGLFAYIASSNRDRCPGRGRTGRRPFSCRPTKIRPHIDALEERQLLSGFGPQDGAYILEPWIGAYGKVQIQPGDQKIVAAGQVDPSIDNTDQRLAIARYDSLGNPDTTYGIGGPSIPPLSGVSAPALGSLNERGRNLVLQPDGRAVVSGQSYSGLSAGDTAFAVARFNTNGTLDTSFGSGGWNSLNLPARGFDFNNSTEVKLQSNGKIVVAGYSLGFSGAPTLAETARFTASGAVDSGKGAYGDIAQGKAVGYTLTSLGMSNASFGDLAVQPDDKLVAVGTAYATGSTSGSLAVARYTASGSLDKTFNGTGYTLFLPVGIPNARAVGVALQSNGKIVVAGFCTGSDGADDLLVARFNTNGTPDTTFGGGGGYVRLDDGTVASSSERGREVAIQPDGKIVVAGVTYVDGNGNPSRAMVARFNVDGTPDSTFAPGGYKIGAPPSDTGFHSFDAVGVALQSDGSIIVSGGDDQDPTNNSVGHPFLMRFYGNTPALQAASQPTDAAATQILERGVAESLINKARAYWQARGTDTSRLGHIDIAIADLGGTTLGLASGHTITLDDNAAGWGWNVGRAAGRGRKAIAGRMDLLSAMVHEVGHLLGHDHAEGGVMAETLAPGVRVVPQPDPARGSDLMATTSTHALARRHRMRQAQGR